MSWLKLLPIPIVDTVSAEAAAALDRLTTERIITSAIDVGDWYARVLAWRADGTLTLRGAAYLASYVLVQAGLHGNGPFWSRLALIDWLGRVNATTLGPTCISRLARDLDTLYHQASTKGAPTFTELVRYAESRQRATLTICGPVLAPFAAIYTRATTALREFYTT